MDVNTGVQVNTARRATTVHCQPHLAVRAPSTYGSVLGLSIAAQNMARSKSVGSTPQSPAGTVTFQLRTSWCHTN